MFGTQPVRTGYHVRMSPPPAARYYRLYTLALAGVLAVVLPGCGSGGGAAATPGGGGLICPVTFLSTPETPLA